MEHSLEAISTHEVMVRRNNAAQIHPQEACRVGMYHGALNEVIRLRHLLEPSDTGGASEAPVSEEAKQAVDAFIRYAQTCSEVGIAVSAVSAEQRVKELQIITQPFFDSATAELRRELGSLRKQLDEQIVQTSDACTGRDLARHENVEIRTELDRLNQAYAQTWSECDTALEAAGIVMDEDPHKLVVQGIAELRARLESAERGHLQTIDERDDSEEALAQIYYLVIGRSAEWSNNFGHEHAIQDIDDAQQTFRKTIDALQSTVDAQKREIERLTEELRASRFDLGMAQRAARFVKERDQALSDLAEARRELEEAKAGVESYATAARVISLHLKDYCDESLSYPEMIAEAARKAANTIEAAKESEALAVDFCVGLTGRNPDEIKGAFSERDTARAQLAQAEAGRSRVIKIGADALREVEIQRDSALSELADLRPEMNRLHFNLDSHHRDYAEKVGEVSALTAKLDALKAAMGKLVKQVEFAQQHEHAAAQSLRYMAPALAESKEALAL